MQQATAGFSSCSSFHLPIAAATEPIGGVSSIPVNPDHRPATDRDAGKKKKKQLPPEKRPPSAPGEILPDLEQHIDDYA